MAGKGWMGSMTTAMQPDKSAERRDVGRRLERRRVEVLHETGILYSEPSPNFDRLCLLAQRLFDVPVALVSFVTSDRQWFKARIGLDITGTDRRHAFCSHAIESDEVLVVPDAMADARFDSNPLVIGPPHLRFYAGAPIVFAPGVRLGTLCVMSGKPRAFSEQDRITLKHLAGCVLSEMRLIQSSRLLRHALDEQARSAVVTSLPRAVAC
jgi:GAF domain-containing protein